ncbi:hypothetical protein OAE08_05265, partial [Gammaproteobacteria bacterium]|nr:hypothetical protein [Gammaproteobacteria bacterium]
NIANISSNKTPPIPHAIPNTFNLIHCLDSILHYSGFAAEFEKSFYGVSEQFQGTLEYLGTCRRFGTSLLQIK